MMMMITVTFVSASYDLVLFICSVFALRNIELAKHYVKLCQISDAIPDSHDVSLSRDLQSKLTVTERPSLSTAMVEEIRHDGRYFMNYFLTQIQTCYKSILVTSTSPLL